MRITNEQIDEVVAVRPIQRTSPRTGLPQWVYTCAKCGKRFGSACDDFALPWRCPPCEQAWEDAQPSDPEVGLVLTKPPAPKKGYSITPAEVVALAEAQGGLCAICRRAPYGVRGLVVDHNHRTGEVRGLLCQPCNTGIGHMQDDPEIVARALTYLTERGNYAGMKRSAFLGTAATEGAK